jgi:hypothetical protein
MLIVPDYRGHRIEAYAELSDGAWDATVRIRQAVSDEKPHVERLACRKLSAEVAETRAVIYAKRWVDVHCVRTAPSPQS